MNTARILIAALAVVTVCMMADTSVAQSPGDYNNNGELDAGDLDLQAEAITGGQHPQEYDLNNDSLVNFADRLVWVNDLKNSFMGDANLDHCFNSSDQVQKFVSGKYETREQAGWADGDSNGDTLFNSSDMVADFVAGFYGWCPRPPVPAVTAVPEPGGWLLLVMAAVSLLTVRRRRCGPIVETPPPHARRNPAMTTRWRHEGFNSPTFFSLRRPV